MNVQYEAFASGSRDSIDSVLKSLHVDSLVVIGTVIDEMKSYESSIDISIQNRANEIGNNSSECIIQARHDFRNASVTAGDVINNEAREWYDSVSFLYDEESVSIVDMIHSRNSAMLVMTLNFIWNRNPVTEIQRIIDESLEIVTEQVEGEFENFVEYFLEIFAYFENFGIDENLILEYRLNTALEQLQTAGETIQMSLNECV